MRAPVVSVHDIRRPHLPVSTYGMVRPQIRPARHRLPRSPRLDAGLLVIHMTLATIVALALIAAAVVVIG